jgi:hypothetical protein
MRLKESFIADYPKRRKQGKSTAPPVSKRGSLLIVGGSGNPFHAGNLGGNLFLHFADSGQVRVNALSFSVEDFLTIQEHFHNALASRGDSYSDVWAVSPEKLIRHPRGGSEMLSGYAVGNL